MIGLRYGVYGGYDKVIFEHAFRDAVCTDDWGRRERNEEINIYIKFEI